MADNGSKFLASIFTYPWDLVDEGLDTSLARVADVAGCGEVMLTPSYHVATYFLPHNPQRPLYYGEDGAVYFTPDESKYSKTRIQPRISEVVDGPEFMDQIVAAIEKRNLKFGAWFVYLYNHYLARTYPEFAKHDAFGNPYLGQLSPSPPDVREYVVALTTDFVETYRPAAVYIESLQRLKWDYGFRNPKVVSEITERCQFLLSLCFNPATVANANQTGMDADRFQHEVAGDLRQRLQRLPIESDRGAVNEQWIDEAFDGQLKRYLDAGRNHTTELWKRVAAVIHANGAEIHGGGIASLASSRHSDLDESVNQHVQRVDVSESWEEQPDPMQVAQLRGQIPDGGKVLLPLSPGSYTHSEPLTRLVRDAAAAGIDGVTVYNYGLLRQEQLEFMGAALRSI